MPRTKDRRSFGVFRRAPGAFLRELWKKYPDELRIAGAGALVAFFFTHGLPLWNDDYSQWLAQANGSLFELVNRILLPFTWEPQTWGYSDRPLQVLIYKILYWVFGYWGAGYFLAKSLAFGAFCGFMYHWIRKQGVDRFVAHLVAVTLILSTNALASVIWLSDFSVVSQLILGATLFWALPIVEKGPSGTAVYRKGLAGMPKPFVRFLILFFLAVYFGSKVRGDVRLAPVILLTYLYVFRRERFQTYLAPFGIAFLATLPWSTAMFKQLPPFVPGASGYQGWTYAPFSVFRVFEFLAGDLFSWNAPSLSVLGAAGGLLTLTVAAYGLWRVYREKLDAPDARWGFFLTWLGAALLACGVIARQSPSYQLRYTMLPLVPALFLLAMVLQAGLKEFHRWKWLRGALTVAVASQGLVHAWHSVQHRRDIGRTTVAVDRLFRAMEQPEFASGTLLFGTGFLPYGFRPSTSSALSQRKAMAPGEDIAKYPAGSTFTASWGPTLDVRFTVAYIASGCGSSIVDLLLPCAPTDAAFILKYLGPVPEVAKADELDRGGNLAAAKDVLEEYIKKEPGNYGVTFILSLYHYRLRNYARMDQLYDVFGPHFLAHGSVVYNWALAKQALQKYREASELFERALALWPNDYAIGFNYAETLYRQGKKKRALATLDGLMKVYPNDRTMKLVYEDWSKN